MKIKICCIGSVAEAQMALAAGADALGLVSAMPSGPGVIDDHAIAEIIRSVPGADTFLLTSEVVAEAIVVQCRRLRPRTVQLVDAVPTAELDKLRDALPELRLVQVIHVNSQASLQEALAVASQVDALLLDSGDPTLTIKELGGTGRTHDWQISRQIVEQCRLPVYLAGGLNAGNVGLAIAAVRPYGLDLCSGVRINGKLDKNRLIEYIGTVRSTEAAIASCRK